MISLDEYLKLNEALVKGNVKNADNKIKQTILFPEMDKLSNEQYHFKSWKKIKIPQGNFVIYIDRYHRNKYHISDINDMMASVGTFYDDYEDFSAEDVIAVFSTLKEAVKYALENGFEDYYDTQGFAEEVLHNKIKDKDYLETYENENIIDSINDYAGDVDNLTEMIKTYKQLKRNL